MSDANLLALLKRIEFAREYDYGDSCPECRFYSDQHRPACELKAQIDRLEAEDKQAIELKKEHETKSGRMEYKFDYVFGEGIMRCRHSRIPPNESPAIDVCNKCSLKFDLSGMEPPTSERNEGHA